MKYATYIDMDKVPSPPNPIALLIFLLGLIVPVIFGFSTGESVTLFHGLLIFAAVILFGGLYLLPSIIAYEHKTRGRFWLFFINVFFGATFLAWIMCLVWAAIGKSEE